MYAICTYSDWASILHNAIGGWNLLAAKESLLHIQQSTIRGSKSELKSNIFWTVFAMVWWLGSGSSSWQMHTTNSPPLKTPMAWDPPSLCVCVCVWVCVSSYESFVRISFFLNGGTLSPFGVAWCFFFFCCCYCCVQCSHFSPFLLLLLLLLSWKRHFFFFLFKAGGKKKKWYFEGKKKDACLPT